MRFPAGSRLQPSIVDSKCLIDIAEPCDPPVLHDHGPIAKAFDQILGMRCQHKDAGVSDEGRKPLVCFLQEVRIANSDAFIKKKDFRFD
jgi:hypothetical protein